MKLSKWAKQQGVSYMTAWRWFRDGKLPVEAEQMPTGTIIVKEAIGIGDAGVALYARVSSAEQKPELDKQIARLLEFASQKKLAVIESVTEIGSAMNGHRPKLLKLLRNPSVKIILVEHRDRLIRFGFDYLEASLAAQGRRIVVVDDTELKDDLVRDMTEVLTSFCARLYGRRAANNKARKALRALEDES
ncbi:MAG: IS607 family transposase [Acidobacteria bacterium]|nr:IS607 family transposase [Acidobacteriota bacterium]